MPTLRQQLIASMFLKDVSEALKERDMLPDTSAPTGDADFDEFFGVIDSSVLVYFTIPWGMTKEEYVVEVKAALTAILEGTPLDTPSMREAIRLIGASNG